MSALLCELSPVVILHRRSLTHRSAIDPNVGDACHDGLALFDEFVKLQGHKSSLRLTITHLLWAAADERSRSFLCWAQEVGVLPWLNLYNANLYGADLRNANLYNADLRNADLSYADLSYADLRNADLYGANLRNANLRGAILHCTNLNHTNLSGANLNGANLYGANLYGANLYGASLNCADLSDADLSGAWRDLNETPIKGWFVRDCRLERAQ